MNIEGYQSEALFHKVMKNGKRLAETTLEEIPDYRKLRQEQLPEEYKRFVNAHIYKIGLSDGLKTIRDSLIKEYKENKYENTYPS